MLRDFLLWLAEQDAIRNQVLAFTFGASMALAMSFFSKERRSCKMLVAGSFLGGVGAVLALRAAPRGFWILPSEIVMLASALGLERIAIAWQRVTDDFSKNPFGVARKVIALIAAYGTAIKNVKLDDDPVYVPPSELPPDMQAQIDELDRVTGQPAGD